MNKAPDIFTGIRNKEQTMFVNDEFQKLSDAAYEGVRIEGVTPEDEKMDATVTAKPQPIGATADFIHHPNGVGTEPQTLLSDRQFGEAVVEAVYTDDDASAEERRLAGTIVGMQVGGRVYAESGGVVVLGVAILVDDIEEAK